MMLYPILIRLYLYLSIILYIFLLGIAFHYLIYVLISSSWIYFFLKSNIWMFYSDITIWWMVSVAVVFFILIFVICLIYVLLVVSRKHRHNIVVVPCHTCDRHIHIGHFTETLIRMLISIFFLIMLHLLSMPYPCFLVHVIDFIIYMDFFTPTALPFWNISTYFQLRDICWDLLFSYAFNDYISAKSV
jgi:hypothetical protein